MSWLSADSLMRLMALNASQRGDPSDSWPGTHAMQVGFGVAGGAYCKHCMYYCPDSQLMEQHTQTCMAKEAGHSASALGGLPKDIAHKDAVKSRGGNSSGVAKPFDPARPFVCSRCGRSYQLAQSLQRHRWKCDQSRPLACSLCDAVYYRADNLQSHIKSVHNM